MNDQRLERRPIAARNTAWAAQTSSWLARRKVHPDFISTLSVMFSLLAAVSLISVRGSGSTLQILLYALAGLAIPCRLLCNMFDGMVAVEGGIRSKVGDLFNEFPDRISDSLLFAAAGYAIPFSWGADLGWLTALLAVLTAYTRTLGAAIGSIQPFCGPFAKQQRMASLSAACGLSMVEILLGWPPRALGVILLLVMAGTLLTLVRRIGLIAQDLKNR